MRFYNLKIIKLNNNFMINSFSENKNITSESTLMKHIRGKIDFIGQVAKANKEINKKHYKTRMNIYYNLMTQYKKLEQLVYFYHFYFLFVRLYQFLIYYF